MLAYEICLEMSAVDYGDGYVAVGIEEVDRGNVGKAVFGDDFEVFGGGGAATGVGGVAFDNGAIELSDEGLNKLRIEKIMPAGLAGGNFDGDRSGEIGMKGLKNLDKAGGSDSFGEINLRLWHDEL